MQMHCLSHSISSLVLVDANQWPLKYHNYSVTRVIRSSTTVLTPHDPAAFLHPNRSRWLKTEGHPFISERQVLEIDICHSCSVWSGKKHVQNFLIALSKSPFMGASSPSWAHPSREGILCRNGKINFMTSPPAIRSTGHLITFSN